MLKCTKCTLNCTMCTLAKIIFVDNDAIEYYTWKNKYIIPWCHASNIALFCLVHTSPQYQKMEIISGRRGYFSLKPSNLWVSFQLPEMKSDIGTSMKQLPTVTAFAVKGHKTQGATLENIFVCGYGSHSNGRSGRLYVVKSRVKDIKNIFLLTKLTKKASEFKTRERVVAEDNPLYEGSR